MRRHLAAVSLSLAFPTLLLAQDQIDPEALKPIATPVEARIEAVTVYLGRASVTRTAEVTLNPGVYDLIFSHLPESVQRESLQARAEGPAKVLGVQFQQKAVAQAAGAKVAALDQKIDEVTRSLATIAEQHKINASEGAFIDGIGVRLADDASQGTGTAQLDLAKLREQMAFIAEERARLATRRLELDQQQRGIEAQLRVLQAERASLAGAADHELVAVVTTVVTAPSQVNIALTYLVNQASWEPKYNIRAAADGSIATIEYDALLIQRTGEDWENVKLTLSTAQPTIAANPPSLQPWFVDIIDTKALGRGFGREAASVPAEADRLADHQAMPMDAAGAEAGNPIMLGVELRTKLAELGQSAAVSGAGPSVTFQLPRLVSVKSSSDQQQTTRIASIDAQPQFIHIAVPSLTEAVYVRGDLVNASSYQLLSGPAAIFVGADYVGPTTLAAVAPQGEFELHFGIDQAVKATRQLVSKKTSKTGLFNGGLRTLYDYRLTIDNGAGKAINLELWDRVPMSRSDDVKINVADLSHPLATDADYVETEKPQGMLKWDLRIPANASGKSAEVVTYQLTVDRAADVKHTPLPE
jgi:uncharacterized protein (TIGR02231 family)